MVIYALFIFLIILLLLIYFKPSMMFDINGNIKKYDEGSLLTLEIIVPFIALLSYFIVLVINVVST